jgi:DNA-binding beta-propeller fold protein YncE
MKLARTLAVILAIALFAGAQAPQKRAPRKKSAATKAQRAPEPSPTAGKQAIPLSTSKTLYAPVPGSPQRTNSFPANVAVSPDRRYAALLNQGWTTRESGFHLSIAILDLQTNQLTDFPDSRFGHREKQSYFFGLAWSPRGDLLYVSVGSLPDPTGSKPGNIGGGIAVYRFANGTVTPERFMKIAPQPLAAGKRRPTAFRTAPQGFTPFYPAHLAVVPGASGERLLVADNYGDAALLIDAQSGNIVTRFDLSAHNWVPAEFPLGVAVSRDGRRGWVSLWNTSRVVELDLADGKVTRQVELLGRKLPTEAGSHPSALLLSRDEKLLYVALANADTVAVVDTATLKPVRGLSTMLPLQDPHYGGVYPVALALNDDNTRLYVADAAADAVAVFNVANVGAPSAPPKSAARSRRTTPVEAPTDDLSPLAPAKRMRPLGFIPTEWYPCALAVVGNDLIVATAKGRGTGPNNAQWNLREGTVTPAHIYPYIYALLAGSVARVDLREAAQKLASLTREVQESNLMVGSPASWIGRKPPIRHVLYVIRENRTYDQILGDMKEGNGDAALVMYGEDVTPNAHKLARQFGLLDNFYVSSEVSGDGHVWSTAAIASDYTEATVPINYRNSDRTYDYEGSVLNEVPLEQGIPDVNEPGTGYIWTNVARNRLTYRIYGEYVASKWCSGEERIERTTDMPEQPGECGQKTVAKGEPLPANVGDPKGGPSPWPWAVQLFGPGTATKPEIRGHYDPNYPGFNTSYPDQLRVDQFLNEFANFVHAKQEGRKQQELPAFVILRLPNDHTAGTRPNEPRPAASVADNDIALGRVVEAISHSPYWDDTAIFILEDDAQNGADHVDAHRSPALIVSKYSPRAENAGVYVDHHFYTTVNLIRTMEAVLGLPPMNNNDARAALMAPLFTGPGDQAPYTTDYRNRDNGLIYQFNPPNAPGAQRSLEMDFSRPDGVDADELNAILWREAKGEGVPVPVPRHTVIPVRPGKD